MSEEAPAPAPGKAEPRRQLINVIHHNKARYDSQWFGKGECVLMIEKVTMPDGRRIKRLLKVTEPTIKYHVTAPSWQDQHTVPELSYPADRVDEYESPLKDVNLHVAELTGQMSYFNETKGPGANARRRKLHDHRHLHGSDVNVADGYIDRYMERFASCLDTTSKLDMAFADIEVDGIEYVGFPSEFDAPVPISLITYFYRPTKHLYQYALRNLVRPNPQIAEFEADLDMHRLRMLCEGNRPQLEAMPRRGKDGTQLEPIMPPGLPWEDIAAKLGYIEGVEADPRAVAAMRVTDVTILFYDTEIELLEAFFHQVNEIDRPDILAFWRMSFDINTIIGRAQRNGLDPNALFSPEDFRPWFLADYNVDTFNSMEPTECGDVFTASSYTIYVDQMLLYAQLRKSGGKKASYSLNAVISAEIKENKFEIETGSIRTLAYTNYANFMTYGMGDVLPMSTLEDTTDDIAMAYQISMITRTRFHKVLKKTVCLRNLAHVLYRKSGLILSNNRNRNKERVDTEKFRGAWTSTGALEISFYAGIPR